MPHINRIRVNNVKYNFGTQFYDDFIMRFSGKNTIYDLANGGGKSVLMLLLFQNLIPNCTLDDKQPIEKLFRTGEGSKTIHSLIEWNLSDVHIKDNYKYMLTGFCARKAKETEDDNRDNATIEYFNYCIFYREYNDNDIKNLPLSNGRERVTYNGLKNYLRDLERKDLSLSVKIFEKKSDYQRFIADYGLYESEWEIIRGINKTEGHVRTYFETNYKTTRKVVEDLLIEEIIQKSFVNKYGAAGEDTMAQTLLDIKDKLIELSEKKEQINSFDRQQEMIEGFISRTASIKNLYFGKEDLENQVCRIYNTIRQKEDRYTDNRDELESGIADIRENMNNLSRLCDTAVISIDKRVVDEMNQMLEVISESAGELKDKLAAKEGELRFKESANDYLDFIKYKKEADTVRETIAARRQDSSDILAQAEELVGEIYNRNQLKLSELNEVLDKEQQSAEMENDNIAKLAASERDIENQLAVAGYRAKDASKEYDIQSKNLSKAMNEAGVLVVSSISSDIRKTDESIDTIKKSQTELEEKLEEIAEQSTNMQISLENKRYELGELNKRQVQLESEISKMTGRNERYDKISKVYADKKIEQMLRDVIRQIASKESEIQTLTQSVELCRKNIPVPTPKEVEKLCDYIERYHGNVCVPGGEYLSRYTEEEREELVGRVPMIAYSIVITEDFRNIVEDTRIMEMCSDSFVIIINEEAITEYGEILNEANTIIATDKKDIFISDKALSAKLAKETEKLTALRDELERLYEYEKVIRDDYVFASTYENIDYETELLQCSDRTRTLEKEIEFLDSGSREYEDSRRQIIARLQENESILEKLMAEKENRKSLEALSEVCGRLEEKLSSLKEETEQLSKNHKNIMARLEAAQNQAEIRRNKINNIISEKNAINDVWENKYKSYHKPQLNVHVEGNYESIEAKLNGLIAAINDENSDLADKEKLLNNYEDSKKKAMSNIKYRGTDVEALEKSYLDNELVYVGERELTEIKNICNKINSELENTYREMDDIKSKRDKSDGGIAHGIRLIEEKYGVFDESQIPTENVKDYIETNKLSIEKLSEKQKELEKKLKRLGDFAGKQVIVKENLERIIAGGNIDVSKYSGTIDEDTDIYAKSKEISKRYDEFVKTLYEKKEEFESNKKMLIETLNSLNSAQLAMEIDRNVMLPDSVEETNALVTRLKDTNMCIELEKSRINKGIEDMEHIKDNFENQCIQSCIKIRTELERLPKLSKITMEGDSISIIDLRIPYISEERYKERMSEYIDETANEADSLNDLDEKLRYIRSRLTWKKMFSVIVNDMNAIRLKLYKRERIVENSRYLPYEEAVGSTGQSQGIYIQFLVAIINYISSVNSRGADASKLKKVIFIDNPFGAAKDVYIWEPIFKLLKTNNVQLVVPARGATPAITGRFDVNYVLGQRLVNGRQQTVVVDYFSNVDNSTMEYTTLSYEQTSMF